MFKIFYRTNFSEKSTSQSRVLEDYQRFSDCVEGNFTTKHNVSDYVADLGTTAKRLNSLCKKVKGVTGKQIIDARVLLEAKRLLGYTLMPISEIAITLGYQEPTNLA